jgi:hypothetical protein
MAEEDLGLEITSLGWACVATASLGRFLASGLAQLPLIVQTHRLSTHSLESTSGPNRTRWGSYYFTNLSNIKHKVFWAISAKQRFTAIIARYAAMEISHLQSGFLLNLHSEYEISLLDLCSSYIVIPWSWEYFDLQSFSLQMTAPIGTKNISPCLGYRQIESGQPDIH